MNYLSAVPGKLTLDEFHTLAAVVNQLRPPYGGWFALEGTPEEGDPKHNLFGDAEQTAYFHKATLVYCEPSVNYSEDRKTYDFDSVSPLAVATMVGVEAFPGLKDNLRTIEAEIYRILETL